MKNQRISILGALFVSFALAGCNTEDNGPALVNPKSGAETQADVQNPFGVKQKVRTAKNQPTDIR
jgi:hypothetical protein